MIAHACVSDLSEKRVEPRLECGTALRRIDRLLGALAEPQHIDQRARALEALGERGRALAANEVVWIHRLGQESEAEGMTLAQHRQHAVDGARGSSLAGP